MLVSNKQTDTSTLQNTTYTFRWKYSQIWLKSERTTSFLSETIFCREITRATYALKFISSQSFKKVERTDKCIPSSKALFIKSPPFWSYFNIILPETFFIFDPWAADKRNAENQGKITKNQGNVTKNRLFFRHRKKGKIK